MVSKGQEKTFSSDGNVLYLGLVATQVYLFVKAQKFTLEIYWVDQKVHSDFPVNSDDLKLKNLNEFFDQPNTFLVIFL